MAVISLGIKRRVEINQVNAVIRDGLAKDLRVIAEIEMVHYLSSPFANFRAQSSLQKWNALPPNLFSTERDSGT